MGSDSLAPHLPFEIQDSVHKGVLKLVRSQMAGDLFQSYLQREFPGAEKVVIRGKKSGEVELKKSPEGITIVLSSDGGAWRRFEQRVAEAEEKVSKLLAIASDSILARSEGSSIQSVAILLVDQFVNDLTQWAQNDFKGHPTGSVYHLLPPEVGEKIGIEKGSNVKIDSDKIGTRRSWIKRVSEIGNFSKHPGVSEELHANQHRLEKEIGCVSKKIQNGEWVFDKEAIAEHAKHLGHLGMVSLTRYFSSKNRDCLWFFSKEIVKVFEQTTKVFEKSISQALRKGDDARLHDLYEVAQTFLQSWKKSGIFALLQVIEEDLQSPIKLRDKYESWFLRAGRTLKDLLHSNTLLKNDLSNVPTDVLPIEHLLPVLEGVLPSLKVPSGGDLLPYRAQIFRFGKELIALARSSEPKHADWYQGITIGRRHDGDFSEGQSQPLDEDFPLYVLELLHQMCGWAASAAPMQSFPNIQAGYNLYDQLTRRIMCHGAINLFDEMMEKGQILPSGTLESNYQIFEKVAGMLKDFDLDDIQSSFISIAKYFWKFQVLSRQAEEAHEAGAFKDERKLRESAVEVMIGCGKYFLGLPREYQEDMKEEALTILSQLPASLDFLDSCGNVGRQLTAIETVVAMMAAVDDTSEQTAGFRARLLRVSNELIKACEYTRTASISGHKHLREMNYILSCVEAELQKWEPLGAFPGSRSHCMDELRKSRMQIEKGRKITGLGQFSAAQ